MTVFLLTNCYEFRPCCPVVRHLCLKKTNHYKVRNFFSRRNLCSINTKFIIKIFRFKHKNASNVLWTVHCDIFAQ